MGVINYKTGTVTYTGLTTPPSTLKAVSLAGKIYADVPALVAGESLSAGSLFYIADSGDLSNGALLTAMTTTLGAYVDYAPLPYNAFKVGTPATTVTYYTLTAMGQDPVAFLAQFAAIDAAVLAAANGSFVTYGSAWGNFGTSKMQQDPTTGKITDGVYVSASTGSGN